MLRLWIVASMAVLRGLGVSDADRLNLSFKTLLLMLLTLLLSLLMLLTLLLMLLKDAFALLKLLVVV